MCSFLFSATFNWKQMILWAPFAVPYIAPFAILCEVLALLASSPTRAERCPGQRARAHVTNSNNSTQNEIVCEYVIAKCRKHEIIIIVHQPQRQPQANERNGSNKTAKYCREKSRFCLPDCSIAPAVCLCACIECLARQRAHRPTRTLLFIPLGACVSDCTQ